MKTLRTIGLGLLALAMGLTMAGAALGQSTTWTGGSADWGTGSNWSAGEPTAGVDAIVNSPSNPMVTQSGEVCRNLLMGSAGGALLDLTGGSLTVNSATVGMASPNVGASIALSAIGNPVLTVTHSLTLGALADVVAGGGTLNIGTTASDSLVLFGTFQLTNTQTVNVTNLSMRDGSVFSCVVGFTGLTGIVVSGTAVLNGKLKVQDFFSPDATYEIIRANNLVGTFDTVELPAAGNWSWRIEGNSVFLTKGEVAVEPATWSAVKSRSLER